LNPRSVEEDEVDLPTLTAAVEAQLSRDAEAR
jgi:hypothetical protein